MMSISSSCYMSDNISFSWKPNFIRLQRNTLKWITPLFLCTPSVLPPFAHKCPRWQSALPPENIPQCLLTHTTTKGRSSLRINMNSYCVAYLDQICEFPCVHYFSLQVQDCYSLYENLKGTFSKTKTSLGLVTSLSAHSGVMVISFSRLWWKNTTLMKLSYGNHVLFVFIFCKISGIWVKPRCYVISHIIHLYAVVLKHYYCFNVLTTALTYFVCFFFYTYKEQL